LHQIRQNIVIADNISYFDYTASGLAYRPIEERILGILETYANIHSEASSSAQTTSRYYEEARESLHKSLGVGDEFFVLPCGTGSTAAIKRFQELMGIYLPPATKARLRPAPTDLPLVIVGPYEHHSNEVSFREALCECVRVPLKGDNIDLDELSYLLEQNRGREIIASFSAASNVTGILSPIEEIYRLVKSHGGIVAIDAATASAHINIDSRFYDALFLSPHKLLGGVGSCGLLVIRRELVEGYDTPTFVGGGTVEYVSRTSQRYCAEFTKREDAGTPGIVQFIRAAMAYELRNKIGLDEIARVENRLKCYFGSQIEKMQGVRLYCDHTQEKLPIFSLNIDGIDPYQAAEILSSKYGIQVRAGCSCAGPYGHDLLGLQDDQELSQKPGWIRISLHFTHTKDEIDKLLGAIDEIARGVRA
jgi:selenocysteine lyase/cysteine desulfurase